MQTLIDQRQNQILQEFSNCRGDRHEMLKRVILSGRQLKDLPGRYKTVESRIKGCQYQIWLLAEWEGPELKIFADSNSLLIRGILSLLLRCYRGLNATELLAVDLSLLCCSDLNRLPGLARNGGLTTLDRHLKERIKLAQKTYQESPVLHPLPEY